MAKKAEARLRKKEEKRTREPLIESRLARVVAKDIEAAKARQISERVFVSFLYTDETKFTWQDWSHEELCELLPFF